MKNIQALLILMIIIILAGFTSCSKETTSGTKPVQKLNLDSISFPHSMKGWELYSWPNGNDWNYSILTGTNRLKTYNEVTSNNIKVTGIDSLKMLLDKFPQNEEILWPGVVWLQSCWGNSFGNLSPSRQHHYQ